MTLSPARTRVQDPRDADSLKRQALSMWSEALKIDEGETDRVIVAFNAGNVLAEMGRLEAAIKMYQRVLDLSENDLDGSAAAPLRRYLAEPACALRWLGLEKADIDDAECVELMAALERNRALRSLTLAHNLIGTGEH